MRPKNLNCTELQFPESKVTYILDELADIITLVSLNLDHFTILWMIDHRPIASKFLLGDKIFLLQYMYTIGK